MPTDPTPTVTLAEQVRTLTKQLAASEDVNRIQREGTVQRLADGQAERDRLRAAYDVLNDRCVAMAEQLDALEHKP